MRPLIRSRAFIAPLLALALACAACGRVGVPVPGAGGVPTKVKQLLDRGVNASIWFAYRDSENLKPEYARLDGADLKLIKALGFHHVRISVDHDWITHINDPTRPDAEHLAELHRAVADVTSMGMLAIVTLVASEPYRAQVAAQDDALNIVAKLWQNMAADLVHAAPTDMLVFEVLNEPMVDDAARSHAIMQRLLEAVRSVAPGNTVAVAGHKYSSLPQLLEMQPLADANTVYTFHFYEPYNFTHQGATWGYDMWAKFHDFPYPSSTTAVAPVMPGLAPDARPHALYYGQQHWDRNRLGQMLRQAGDWGRNHHVFVWCSEFGALKMTAPQGARMRWLSDMHQLLEGEGMGWTHFDYVGNFGVVDGPQGNRNVDPDARAGLGLTPADYEPAAHPAPAPSQTPP